MTQKARYQFMIEPEQRDALRRIKQDTGVPEGEQIRRAIDLWLKAKAVNAKAAPRRAQRRRKA